jgi:hypothetical protein
MTHRINTRAWHTQAQALMLALACSALTPALAAPGAHGPNGEHLDAPGAAVNASGLARLPDGSVNVAKLAQRRMAIRTLLAHLPPAQQRQVSSTYARYQRCQMRPLRCCRATQVCSPGFVSGA